MGDSRDLQGEIDRVLKKVQEGVDVFDSIWNKVYDTENTIQKEKFEADLKKGIEKLQRYRDQIETWIQSSEIKDKKALMDASKQIEQEMERFKVCEKETETKAFSKEGLGQQPKTDPKEKAKAETRDWLNNVVEPMMVEVSGAAELEGLVRDLSSESVVKISVTRLDDLREAGLLLQRLDQICGCRCGWKIEEDSAAALLEAKKYYEKLDQLELRLGVLRLELLDVEDGIAVRNLRRQILTEAHSSSITSHLFDKVIVEAQEIERTACVLGFSGSLVVDGASTGQLEDSKREALYTDSSKTPLDPEVEKVMKAAMVSKIECLCRSLHKAKTGQFSLQAMD